MPEYRSATEWKSILESRSFFDKLISIYGDFPNLVDGKIHILQQLLARFCDSFDKNQPLFIVRIPARINLMGVHIEHRGGYINTMTIAKELWMAVSPRDDDQIHFINDDPQYAPFSFKISDEFPVSEKQEWTGYIDTVTITKGDWQNYVRASCFYLQNQYSQLLNGMNVAVSGNIPAAAGLSSSSAMVVGTACAMNEVNQLGLSRKNLTLMTGEAEWYVGTRGGAGDHAAILFGKRNHLAHIQFFPLQVDEAPFPDNLVVVACHSRVEAKKSAGARDIFNGRIVAYELGFLLWKKKYPDFPEVHHLRDYNVRHLDIPLAELYGMFLDLPVNMTRAEAYSQLPGDKKQLDTLFSTHNEPEQGYPIRSVVLFGLSECERGLITANLLHSGNINTVGQLMYRSHDGDRVTNYDFNLEATACEKNFDKAYFQSLIQRLRDGATDEKTGMAWQSGGYDCSTQEVDKLVYLCKQVDGVYGAGLTGAGLGGMVLALCEKSAVSDLLPYLEKNYYAPRSLPLSAEICQSTEGLTVLL
ncbi:hypothetical protein KAH55_03220 [bacterium]|nr:hypothetical protein [bacterium]